MTAKFSVFSEIFANFVRSKRTFVEKWKLCPNRQNSLFYGVVNLFARRTLFFGKSFSAKFFEMFKFKIFSEICWRLGDLASGLDFEPKDSRFNPQTAQKSE
jgi:hypothetical protein